MRNPYEVLGIKEGATKEEIRAAYKKQVKKYHPDRHHDNPLYKLAEEKLQEINDAYDYLMKNESNTGRTTYNNNYKTSNAEFQGIRQNIDRGNLPAAEAALNRIKNRGAEWHFLNGMISLKKGWYDNAISNIQTAVSMEPGNLEYKNAMNNLMQASGGYRTSAYGRGFNNDELCRMMQCYCCADALCDCF